MDDWSMCNIVNVVAREGEPVMQRAEEEWYQSSTAIRIVRHYVTQMRSMTNHCE